jgi:putative glutamine amidotransferase
MPPKNLVAVSASSAEWKGAERVKLHVNYVRSLEGAGLVPVIVPPLASPEAARSIVESCSGLLLTGGEDVDPARYSEAPHPTTGAPHPMRDLTEIALFEAARARRMPVLAICRGIQLANVALGGSLVQDIPSQRPTPVAHDQPQDAGVRTHAVAVAAGSRLAEALGATELEVNSYHHQSVNRLASGLRVTATAPDGIIEGVESEDPTWWMVAVQWHPEDLTTDGRPWDRGLFAAFARVLRHGS